MPNAGTTLEDLHVLLQVASEVVQDLTADPIVRRLLEAFSRIPERDRATIVDVVEREAALRELSKSSGMHTGVRLDRPNPHAHLYVRAVGPHGTPAENPEHERMVHASIEAAKQTRFLFRADIHDEWRRALAVALVNLDADTRADVERLVREVLEALAETGGR